jgi:elongation factor 1-alpha
MAGEIVGVEISLPDGETIRKGDLLGDPASDPPLACDPIIAQIVILNRPGSIRRGFTPIVYCHTGWVGCQVTEIYRRMDSATGKTYTPLHRKVLTA